MNWAISHLPSRNSSEEQNKMGDFKGKMGRDMERVDFLILLWRMERVCHVDYFINAEQEIPHLLL